MPAPAWLTAAPIAHRGLHDVGSGIPENTPAAFERAAGAGYPIELDVRLSLDGIAMVFHDADLMRLAGRELRIDQATAAELRSTGLAGTRQCIPTLDETLALVGDRVPMIVELKNGGVRVGRLESAVARLLSGRRREIAVSSFNPRTVAWFARHHPLQVRGLNVLGFRGTGLRTGDPRRLPVLRLMAERATRPHFVGCDVHALPHPTAERLRSRGVPLIAYTVRTPAERTVAESHADNMFFEGFVP
jgi:glycerophosphoryl diester phosphodiesterase